LTDDLTAGLLARIRENNFHDLTRFRRFDVAGQAVGWVRHDQAERLTRYTDVFDVCADRVTLVDTLDTPERRTSAVDGVIRDLAADGVVTGWREECYPVHADYDTPPLFELERAAVDLFGVTGYGVFLNGYVETDQGQSMWVARRSSMKPTFPGMLDVLVGGGVPSGYELRDCLIKEAEEEAGMPAEMAALGRAVGAVYYTMERPLGLVVGVEYCFDVCLPADWRPHNRDGEVAAFHVRPAEVILRQIATTRAFKPSSALCFIDFFQRHGYLDVDHPADAAIRAGLAGRPVPAAGN